MSQIKYINLADLLLPEFEAHKSIPEEHITEITESIRSIGIIEPIIVRKNGKQYEIVAGCVRYRCAKLAGLKAAPCIILSLKDKAAEVIKIHENIKRIPLDHIDQGNTFVMMRDKFSMTEQDISAIVGKSIAYISQHITLVSQDEHLIQSVRERKISFSQARELMMVDDKTERRRLQGYCENDGATVFILKTWVQEYKNSLIKNAPSGDSSPVFSYHTEPHKEWRSCEACDKPIELKDLRPAFFCQGCHTAIKTAIFNEKSKNPDKNTDKDSSEPT